MASIKEAKIEIAKVARESFGFDTLRPGQEDAIRSLLARQDTLVVQPTGAGKSAIYQIAGLLIEGVTVVISPLIALQKDQVDSINSHDAAEAVVINSHKKVSEIRETFEKIAEGKVEYIFLAPEQLKKQETLESLKSAGVSLFVVDEAHCISEWGHDFRPDYLHIGQVIEDLGHPAILALTATASEEVREEIKDRLGMRKPRVLVHGFNRPNIYLRVDHYPTEQEKMQALIHRVQWAEKPGIVYVGTRKNAEQIMRALDEEGVRALFYHGGLNAKDREAIQQNFMSGDAEVIVATNAFGMGVDKSDVRFVYHFDISESIDSYYQEIGRAGRDGEKAEAILFFRSENVGSQKFKIGTGKVSTDQVEKVTEVLALEDGPVAPKEISDQMEISERKLTTVLHRLEDAGAVEILPGGDVQLAPEVDISETLQAVTEREQQHRDKRADKLRQMEEYADSSNCRRQIILRYFGDDCECPCGGCDNCSGVVGSPSEESALGTRREVS